MDIFHTLTKWVSYNRFTVIGIVATIGMVAWLAGCQPTTDSILNPGNQVSAAGLQREAIIIEAQADAQLKALEAAGEDLREQIEFRQSIVREGTGIASSVADGSFSVAGLLDAGTKLALLLVGSGLGLDNLRKGRKIASQKPVATVTTTTQ